MSDVAESAVEKPNPCSNAHFEYGHAPNSFEEKMSYKNRFMEGIITACGESLWAPTNEPAQDGMNAIKREGFRFRLAQCLEIKVPENAKIEGPITTPGGTFMKVSCWGIDINVYNFKDIEIKPGEYISGMVEVMLKTWEPISHNGSVVPDGAVKNYAWYIKMTDAKGEQPEGEVILFNAKRDLDRWVAEKKRAETEKRLPVNATGRNAADMCQDGHFAHSNHAGRNQHFKVVLNDTAAATTAIERRPRRPKLNDQQQPTA